MVRRPRRDRRRGRARALQSVVALAEPATGEVDSLRRRAELLAGGFIRYHAAEAAGIRGLGELLAGDPDAARGQATVLREIAEQTGNGRFTALADVIDGREALDTGDPVQARTLLQRGLGAFAERGIRLGLPAALEALGAVADPAAWEEGTAMGLDRAVAYARRGRGPRERPLKGWGALTPTEEQVVQLAAAGRSNPEIAAELYMSRATVKRHLAHAFDKLGVANRTELAAAAARAGDPARAG